MSDILEQIVEAYFTAVRDVYRLGAGTKERSYYPALNSLFAEIGGLLTPKVLCLADLGNTGAGHPDFGLFAANQVQKGIPRKGQSPERGVIELKSVKDDAWLTAKTAQVTKYFGAYRLVIVSNIRDFLIIGEGSGGQPLKLESFRLAPDADAFWKLVAKPQAAAKHIGKAFGEYLRRALTQSVALREPKDVAWFLASYARDALARVEEAGDLPALKTVRTALEDALGVSFDPEKGVHFFHSTLVQTMFYGVFSAWVLWAREAPRSTPRFEWERAIWHLNVPFVRELFRQLSDPKRLKELHLVEVLNWTAATLNRIEPNEFFKRFNDAQAVQFFYEPFLEAFDPELRKELGVWYTPAEVVTYMVGRVDRALREDLGVADGLASEQVYILDPCCGTGTFLAAVLRRIDESLTAKGLGALKGEKVKQAALSRVFGFEIMPAPLVVAHLQIGLVLQALNASLSTDDERAGVFLTNALTGWEPTVDKPLPFPELEEERKKADNVKQVAPILVILGNPPYNGFAGMAMSEERELSTAYRTTKSVRRPEGQGLNDLYVRFFRMAERRIAEKTGSGIISFISNYSWLDGLSFTGMRERFMEAFDVIRVDCLNGDKYKTGKTTPEGKPDPSIFSTEHNREGIQVGTAIATLVRKQEHSPAFNVRFRQLWGAQKRQELLSMTDADLSKIYVDVTPTPELGLPFVSTAVRSDYLSWPPLPQLLPISIPGVQTKRDDFLVDIDRKRLVERIARYFDAKVSYEEFSAAYPEAAHSTKRYDPAQTRALLVKRGILPTNIVRYCYRAFDNRWVYWEPETKLLGEKSPDFFPNALAGNLWLEAREKQTQEGFDRGTVSSVLADNFGNGFSTFFPRRLDDGHGKLDRINLPHSLSVFLASRDLPAETIFAHIVAIIHSPSYRAENSDALRMDWPRVPLTTDADILATSARLGNELAVFLDTEVAAPGVSTGDLRPLMPVLGAATTVGGKQLNATLRAIAAGWGTKQRSGAGSIVMPGRGRVVKRQYTNIELAAIEKEAEALGLDSNAALKILGSSTFDVYLNADAYWTNVPESVWNYTLGGYQVIKKWLSYREFVVLNRSLTIDESAYVSEMTRRIAAILLMGPKLDANYAAAAQAAVPWKEGEQVR